MVPEIAARSHLEHIDALVARALEAAGVDFAELDGVAATAGYARFAWRPNGGGYGLRT